MVKGFKDFLMRGNVVDLAVAVVIGAAFGKLVDAFVELIMGLIGKFGGQPDFSAWRPADLPLGSFINSVISFLIIAGAVYLIVVVPMNTLAERRAKHIEPETDAPSEEVALLTEIRDALRSRT
jgi:large conductance mechanosensitive channel